MTRRELRVKTIRVLKDAITYIDGQHMLTADEESLLRELREVQKALMEDE